MEALLEASRRFGAKAELAARPADVDRVEVGGLEEDGCRLFRDFGVGRAHYAGDCLGFRSVGNEEHVRVEGALDRVEGRDLLSRPCPPDDDPVTAQLAVVEGMEVLADFEHNVVVYVDY